MSQNLPWWVQAVYKVGVPTAIACYLVYMLAGKVQTNLEAIDKLVSNHAAEEARDMNELNSLHTKQLRILQAMCLHGAKTDEQRQDCLQ